MCINMTCTKQNCCNSNVSHTLDRVCVRFGADLSADNFSENLFSTHILPKNANEFHA